MLSVIEIVFPRNGLDLNLLSSSIIFTNALNINRGNTWRWEGFVILVQYVCVGKISDDWK